MAIAFLEVTALLIRYPGYYHDFKCIASACPDSCCKEWTVDVDAASAAYYRKLEGSLGDRLRAVLQDTEDGTVMEIENGRCPMWRQDGLCRIQAELGHEALCKTCRDFPRICHDYGDFVEYGLELSCPEAARLILTAPLGQLTEKQEQGGEEPGYDAGCMEILLRARNEVFDYLENTDHAPQEILSVLLLYSHIVQEELDEYAFIGEGTPVSAVPHEPLAPDVLLAEAKTYTGDGDMAALLQLLTEIEVLSDTWLTRLQKPAAMPVWSPEIKKLTMYMITRYWLQAVSDFDIVSRMKLTVLAGLTVYALGEDPIQTAQMFSKEVENNADNVENLLDAAYTTEAMTDLNLLKLLNGRVL